MEIITRIPGKELKLEFDRAKTINDLPNFKATHNVMDEQGIIALFYSRLKETNDGKVVVKTSGVFGNLELEIPADTGKAEVIRQVEENIRTIRIPGR